MANATGLATDKKKMNGGARSDLTPGDSLLRPLFLRLVLLFHYTPFTITWCGSLYFFLLFRPEYAPCVSPAVARSVLVAYGVWILTDPSPRHGGFFLLSASSSRRLRNYCRDARIYKWMAEYFSLTLVKSCDLDPSRRYLFVVHPHGFLSTGCVLSLVTEGAGFRAAFPGIERVCCTIAATFTTPFYREWMLACGVVTVDRATIVRQLTRGGERRSVVLVPGGAAEAMHAHPGVFRLVLRHRKGFVRVALQTGCSLVPTCVSASLVWCVWIFLTRTHPVRTVRAPPAASSSARTSSSRPSTWPTAAAPRGSAVRSSGGRPS
mmetsp:Transcript_40350/g.78922  ORF Transcript_40350/g.78922 Transcript_40350/m.78922 type:complete len:321 (-) Transcript_40350:1373-2335(-)